MAVGSEGFGILCLCCGMAWWLVGVLLIFVVVWWCDQVRHVTICAIRNVRRLVESRARAAG